MVWACWPANTVGAFFIALIIFDTASGNFIDLAYHGMVGVLLTCVFWLVCSTFGVAISAAILLVPAVFFLIILLNTWMNVSTDECGCTTCMRKKFVINFKKKPDVCDKPKQKPKCDGV